MTAKTKKEEYDIKKGKISLKALRAITIAIHKGGSDSEKNWDLKLALLAAREANVPKIKVDEAIKKASLSTTSKDFKEVMYEGYLESVAIVVEALTINQERVAHLIKSSFTKLGGALGQPGSVSNHIFENLGFITYPHDVKNEDDMMDLALDAGAEDCQLVGDKYEILSKYDHLHKVKDALEHTLGAANSAKLIWKPKHTVSLDENRAEKVFQLIRALDDLDDVQKVWTNLEISQDVGK